MHICDGHISANARPSDVDDLRQELHILKKIQPHCNILNLLGCCSKPGTLSCSLPSMMYNRPFVRKYCTVHGTFLKEKFKKRLPEIIFETYGPSKKYFIVVKWQEFYKNINIVYLEMIYE